MFRNGFKVIAIGALIGSSIIVPANSYYADYDGNREEVIFDKTFISDVCESIKNECFDENDGNIELTFDEKIAINHDENDERWFDVEDECNHKETAIVEFYDEYGYGYEVDCKTCDQVVDSWYDVIYSNAEDKNFIVDEENNAYDTSEVDIEECDHNSTTIWACWSPDDGATWEEECDICGFVISEWEREEEEEEVKCDHENIIQYELNENCGTYIEIVCADCDQVIDGWVVSSTPVEVEEDDSDEIDNSEAWIADSDEE